MSNSTTTSKSQSQLFEFLGDLINPSFALEEKKHKLLEIKQKAAELIKLSGLPLNKIWVEKGIFYGYPPCCIIDFCYRGFEMTEDQEAVHRNTGFTPCPRCSKKILSGETTIEKLIVDRVCPTEFPYSQQWHNKKEAAADP